MPARSRTGAEPAERPAEPNNASSLAREAQHGGRIAVVIGSTRPQRICPGIAEWFKKAALREYEHEHTRNWSRLVTGYDGFVFVFPQYNWGYPAPLKNALDFLYYEWHDKPATSVTYGTRGGNKGAAQLAGVLEGLHMRPLRDRLEIVITDDKVDEDWQLRDLDATLDPYREQVRQLDAQLVEALVDTQQSS
jgi:NAD(P)H-dependent FMN reductase